MIITDEIRKELIGKKLICRGNVSSLTAGKAYNVIKTEEYENNQLKTLVTVLSNNGKECSYDLMWFVDKQKDEILYDNKSTFRKLRTCPINTDIVINENHEDTFIKALKDNDIIVYIEENTDIYYDDIPEIIKWLQDVYDYSTELKNKVEFVDFNTAKEHMEKDNINKAKHGDYIYYIKNNELLCDDLYDSCSLLLEDINSKEWILL